MKLETKSIFRHIRISRQQLKWSYYFMSKFVAIKQQTETLTYVHTFFWQRTTAHVEEYVFILTLIKLSKLDAKMINDKGYIFLWIKRIEPIYTTYTFYERALLKVK